MVSLFLLLGCNLSYIVDLFAALHELASARARTLLKPASSVRALLKPYGDTLICKHKQKSKQKITQRNSDALYSRGSISLFRSVLIRNKLVSIFSLPCFFLLIPLFFSLVPSYPEPGTSSIKRFLHWPNPNTVRLLLIDANWWNQCKL